MGIFDRLKNAILGTQSHSQGLQPSAVGAANPAPNSARAGASVQSSAGQSASTPPASARTNPTVASGTPLQAVDVEAVLKQMAANKHEPLNWQSSIVDLMKVVDLDPSLENRKTLASELGYTGDTHDSAGMNVWLHRQVMQKLAASGGRVPDNLRH